MKREKFLAVVDDYYTELQKFDKTADFYDCESSIEANSQADKNQV